MATYSFERFYIDGRYKIDNPDRVDGEGNQIYLAQEIETTFPGRVFKVICNDTNADIIFEEDLTTEEQATLADVINAHQSNT